MLIEISNKGKEKQIYTSVIPETVRICEKIGFDAANASVGENPHVIKFERTAMAFEPVNQKIAIDLYNTSDVMILAERGENLPRIDLHLYCNGSYRLKFERIKVKQTKGIHYFTENNLFTCCGFKYKAMYGDIITHNAKKNHFYEASVSLFERSIDNFGKLIYPETDKVYSIRLIVRKDV